MRFLFKNKTSTNILFYFAYQIIIYLIPFLIAPFLTRTLQETSLGNFTFSNSIAYYFVLLANLGIAKYGQREISTSSPDNIKKRFWSLFVDHLFSSVFAHIVFTVVILAYFKNQSNIYFPCVLYVLSALFDVSWLFFGLEEFKKVTIINGFFAFIKMFLVFLLVKNQNSLLIYQILYYGAFLLSNLTLFIIACRRMGRPSFTLSDCLKHIKPLLFFSLIVAAITLYTIFDKTLVGIFLNKESVAFYEYADRIIAIPKMLILTVGTVLFPKMCSLEAKNDSEKTTKIHKISLFFVFSIGLASIFGILSIGKELVTLYYGNNFSLSGLYVVYMSPLILIVSLGDIFRTQFIIPKKKDYFYLFSVVMNASLNLLISFILIKPLGVLGVIIGTIVAEFIGCLIQIIYCKKYTDINAIGKYFLYFIIVGFGMFAFLRGLSNLIPFEGIWKYLILFACGVFIYSVPTLVLLRRERKNVWKI